MFSKLLITATLLLSTTFLSAQATENKNNIGLPENGTFNGSSFDNVQVNNGNLHIEIPLYTIPGRGLNVSAKYVYDNKGWYLFNHCTRQGVCSDAVRFKDAGWRLVKSTDYSIRIKSVVQTCYPGISAFTYGYTLVEPDGTNHHMLPDPSVASGSACSNRWPTAGTMYADDGSGWVVHVNSSSPTTIIDAIAKNGLKITFGTNAAGDPTTTQTDTNGNKVLYEGGNTFRITDTLGRSIPPDGLGYYDNTGTLQTFSRTVVLTPVSTHLCQFSGADTCSENVGTVSSLQSLTLPGTTLAYNFTFAQNSYGEPLSVSLPTGGQVQWTWATAIDDAGQRVATRTEVPSSGPSGTWTYSNGVVTDPAGNAVRHTLSTIKPGFRDDSIYLQNLSAVPTYETKTEYFQGSTTGTLLKTVVTDYDNTGTVIPIRETTTLNDTNQVSKVETSFDTFTAWSGTFTRKNVTERREYAYGSGAAGSLVRRTDYSYLHQSNSNYLNKNIVDRVSVFSVYDAAGSLKAQTTTSYDGTTLDAAAGAPSHDSSYGTTYLIRGNPTSVSKWLNTTGTNITVATNWYDELGNLKRTQDALSHQTSFSYSDIWGGTGCVPAGVTTYGYRTLTTNALGFRVETHFFPCTGLPERTAEENQLRAGLWTRFTYDSLLRLRRTDLPDGGYTTSDPNDAVPFIITTHKLLDSSTGALMTSEDERDGLGRPVHSRLISDPSGTDYTDTAYDSNGRVRTVSNPYRSTTEATYGITTTSYDALSRTTQVINPDNSSVSTSYSGSCATTTDEAGKKRKSCTDALGRMIQVFEDPTGLNYETDYQYDTLDNLTRVDQHGGDANSANWRTRLFTYDSLSRLLTAGNPESGTITYTYDNDGSVVTKTDARSVITTYHYDALHRVTSKTFSDTAQSTQNFQYDSASVDGIAISNPVGRLVKSYATCVGTISSYDNMGRVNYQRQWAPSGCPTVHYWDLNYTYDLAGNMLTSTNGKGVTLTYDINNAGQVTQITSSLNDAQHPGTLASNVTYTSWGAMSSLTYGNGLRETRTYNSRLQPTVYRVYNPNTGVDTLNQAYGYGTASANNGNLISWSASGQLSFSRSYGYDALNRLSSQADPTCGLGFVYDAWGNRTHQNITAGTCFASLTPVNNLNRLSDTGYAYDAAGDLTSAPKPGGGTTTYEYDAENRLKSVDGGSTASFLYNNEGLRVRKVWPTGQTRYIHDLIGTVVGEVNASNSLTVGYVYLNGQLLAQYKNSTTYFAHVDHLGSTRVLTTVAGAVQDVYDYQPFGEQLNAGNTTSHKFTGKERDSESGLDNFGKRYYGSSMGRFMSPDPLLNSAQPWNPQTWNRYSYTLNNPLRYTDPLGLYVWGNCSGSTDQCKADQQRFRDSISKAQDALKNLDPKSKEAKELSKTLDKLGQEGKGNIKINFGDAGKTDGVPNLGRTIGNSITINYDAVDSVKNDFHLNSSESAALDAGVTTHEGTHAGSGPSILGFIGMRGEHAAYFTESVTYQGLHNTDRPFQLWNESWLAVDQHTLNENRENAIQNAIHPPKQPEQKPENQQ